MANKKKEVKKSIEIEISPENMRAEYCVEEKKEKRKKKKTCCNCKYFTRKGPHLGYCDKKKKDVPDIYCCKEMEE